MELGALVCLPKAPRCAECPLADRCKGRASGDPLQFPAQVKRTPQRVVELWLVATESEGDFLLERPQAKGLLAGLWRWPALEVDRFASQAAEDSGGYSCREWTSFSVWTQVYTHRREVVHPLHLRLPLRCPAPQGRAWVPVGELEGLPLGSRDQRLLSMLGQVGAQFREAPPPWLMGKILT
jgi:A/G-specific adenine glycosylase